MWERGHEHGAGASLRLSVVLTAAILVIEVVAGLASHSLALLADAGHILTDVAALGLAWFAVAQAGRPPDARRTFGYHRTGILTAMANGVTLVLIAVAVVYEAIQRFARPEAIDGRLVIVSATLAIAVNTFIALRLRGGVHNLGVRAALLHVVGDLVASVGVVVAAVIIVTTGWLYADPLISVAIALLVSWGAVRIVRDTVNILLEGVPDGVIMHEVEAAILAVPGVREMHDLHVWSLSPQQLAMSCHLVTAESSAGAGEHIVRAAEAAVCDRWGISHTTIQVETCHPCGAETGHGAGVHNHPHEVIAGASLPNAR